MIKVLFPFEGHTSSIKTGFVEILRINSHIFKGRRCDVATIRNPPRVGPSNCPPREKSGRMTVESVLVGLEPTSRIITLKTMVETPPESKCSDWIVHMKCLYFSFEKKKHVKKRNQKKEGGAFLSKMWYPHLIRWGMIHFEGLNVGNVQFSLVLGHHTNNWWSLKRSSSDNCKHLVTQQPGPNPMVCQKLMAFQKPAYTDLYGKYWKNMPQNYTWLVRTTPNQLLICWLVWANCTSLAHLLITKHSPDMLANFWDS